MGFTRSTTDVNVHRNMPDYPSGEGITTEQLKAAFDSSAAGLKDDLNGLMGELENTSAASYIGTGIIDESDLTDNNVQAKLEYLMQSIQGVALGDIPDGTITEGKMNATYAASLAKKDETLQEGLNAEMLGGTDLATLLSAINECKYEIGTYSIPEVSGADTTSLTLNLGYRPKMTILLNNYANWTSTGGCFVFLIQIGSVGKRVNNAGSSNGGYVWGGFTPTLTDNGITISGFNTNRNSGTAHTGTYIAFK